MNTIVKSVPAPKATGTNKSGSSAADDLRGRESQELVFALSGPVGSGIQFVNQALIRALEDRGYTVVPIKVSQLFSVEADRHGVSGGREPGPPEFQRIWSLQDVGNKLRKLLGEDLGAQLAIKAISLDRVARHPGQNIDAIKPGRIAYIVDQLKHPREAQLLRSVYGNLFYFVGVLSGYQRRKANLVANMTSADAERLIERDRAESDRNGQQLDKTLKLADFFVRNSHHNTEMLKEPIQRLVGLVHADNGITPTNKEKGMYAAQGAALQSACLSRQVGAAIVDRYGNIVATGCNDVPKAGGGLYESGSEEDHRCVFWEGGRCFNDKRKDALKDAIEAALKEEGVPPALARQYSEAIKQKTGIKDLIEFSRAVHAEMDALVKVARRGGPSVQGAFMFTTTYPCHNCARHIVAAGIRAVYFIEPYEKSLASELHHDSIVHEPESDPDWNGDKPFSQVAFTHFEGVSPNRFADLFLSADRKTPSGMAVKHPTVTAVKKSPEFLDNYRQLEAKVIQRLEQKAPASNEGPGAA
jgi:deoxycytidylate deaminase